MPNVVIADEPSTNEEVLLRALNHRVTFEFSEEPVSSLLTTLVEMLPEEEQVSLVFDQRSLRESGIDLDTKVTFRATNIRLRSALNFVVRQIHAGWTLQDELLLITSDDLASSQMLVRAYEVEDLVLREGESDRTPNFKALIDVIQKGIAPNSWSNNDGPGSMESYSLNGYRLVVRQTPANHFEIMRLLNELRDTPPLLEEEPLPAVAKANDEEMPAAEQPAPPAADAPPVK
jgi:hypothetical protein